MEIHFIANSIAGGGAERVMVLLANEFASRNNIVKIVTFNKGQFFELHNSIQHVKLHHGHIKNHTLRCFINLYKFYAKKKNRPDVAIALMPRMILVSAFICKMQGIKLVGCEHNNHLRKVEPWTRFTWNFLYRFTDMITVLTEFDKTFFQKKGANVTVMPNPCTFELVEHIEEQKQKTILAVGGLDRIYHKGFDNLLNLIVPVLKNNPHWRLKIAGGGDKGLKILSNQAVQNDIQNQVEFMGFVKDVKSVMRTSEIFVLPSRYEGLPMVLLEAMSQGMACIAFNCKTGPSEIIDHNENGLLIEDQHQEAFASGIQLLIDNEDLRKKLGKNAVQSLDRYSMEVIMEKWQMLFAKIEAV